MSKKKSKVKKIVPPNYDACKYGEPVEIVNCFWQPKKPITKNKEK